MEQWKDVIGYEGLYQVSNLGNVRSLNYKNMGFAQNIVPKRTNKGYLQVHFKKNGILKAFTIHRLVAMAFIPNEQDLPQINHINENKQDNRVENLEWCTCRYNVKYSLDRWLETRSRPRKRARSESIVQLDSSGAIVRTWDNVREIELVTKMSAWSIHQCCQGKRKTAYGYKWQFAA
ncbi:MAG: NUMOD4 domain-containing protein [Candidatus Dehalobacter alkaniphilus]